MDPQWTSELYERHKTGIYRFALSILKSPACAEDVLQETFVRLLRSGRVPFEPGREQAWLYRVARNRCIDLLRRNKRETEEPAVLPAPPEGNLEFLDLIAPLSSVEQQIVSLKFIGGFTHREIARIMGMTHAGAKKRYERAIQKLRTELEGSP